MNEAVQAPTPVEAPAAPPPAAPSTESAVSENADIADAPFAERLSAAKKGAPKADADKPAEDKPAEAAPEDAEIVKLRAERRARIEAMQKGERERVDRAAARQKAKPQQEAPSDEVRIPKARAAELEGYEKALSDPHAFLDLAEAKNVDPMKLAEAIRERISNPEKLVAFRARQEMTEGEKRLLAKLDPIVQEVADLKAQLAAKDQDAADRAAGQTLLAEVERSARLNPLTARFLAKHGPENFLRYATSFVDFLPEGSGPQALQDLIEHTLENVQLASGEPSTPHVPPKTPQLPAKHTTNTVTNSLASSRTAVADEEAFADLPFDERLRLAKRK